MKEPMTPEQLAEIRAREQAATPGGWRAEPWCSDTFELWDTNGNRIADALRERDARFISAARQDLPALLAEVEQLRAERARAEAVYVQMRNWQTEELNRFRARVGDMREALEAFRDSITFGDGSAWFRHPHPGERAPERWNGAIPKSADELHCLLERALSTDNESPTSAPVRTGDRGGDRDADDGAIADGKRGTE